MQSFDLSRLLMRAVCVVLLTGVLTACAHDPQTLAYRERLVLGLVGPDEVERFRTPAAQMAAVMSSASDPIPPPVTTLENELFSAAKVGDVPRIRQLIKDGARVNATDKSGSTALFLSAQQGEVDSARVLLRSGADVEGRGGAMTPLAAAALRGHTQMVQLLLRAGAAVNAVGMNELTPLMNAVKLNRMDAARALLKAGASTSGTDRAGDNLLVVAITENFPQMLSLLLELGVPPDLADANGLSPLYWAQLLNRQDMAERLIAGGADPGQLQQTVRASRAYTFQEF